MALDITFNLKDSDLEYFREIMHKAQSGVEKYDEKGILDKVRVLYEEVKTDVPEFVASRLKQLETLVAMIEDVEWQIPEEERNDVISVLGYFSEPEDLIPDHIPVLGFLDDAIMIELVVEELRENIEAFNEFCEYRELERAHRDPSTVTSDEWLEAKRRDLHTMMRNRRVSRRNRKSSFRLL